MTGMRVAPSFFSFASANACAVVRADAINHARLTLIAPRVQLCCTRGRRRCCGRPGSCCCGAHRAGAAARGAGRAGEYGRGGRDAGGGAVCGAAAPARCARTCIAFAVMWTQFKPLLRPVLCGRRRVRPSLCARCAVGADSRLRRCRGVTVRADRARRATRRLPCVAPRRARGGARTTAGAGVTAATMTRRNSSRHTSLRVPDARKGREHGCTTRQMNSFTDRSRNNAHN